MSNAPNETADQPAGGAQASDKNAAADPIPPARRQKLQTFRSLRHRDYRLLWFGTIFASAGQWIQQVTIGWLTYQLTGSAFLLGAVNGCRSLPLLLLGPFGGVAADRIDRKRLMLGTQLSLMVVTAIFATIIMIGQIEVWHLFAFSLLTGVGWAFNMPVRQSVIPNLVPSGDLMNAMALNSAGYNATRIVGPSVAGVLIATIGAAENFFLQAGAYLGVATMVFLMRVPARVVTASRSVGTNLAEGGRFIWRHPTIRTQMSLALVPVIIALPYTSLMPIFADDVLDVGPGGYGLLMSAPGLGAVLGTLAIASQSDTLRKGWLLTGSVLALGLSLILFALSRSFPLSLVVLVVAGAAQMSYQTTNQTIIQIATPDALRGRVMGVYILEMGLLPMGSLLAGGVADIFGAPLAVACMGALTCVLALAFAFMAPSLRKL